MREKPLMPPVLWGLVFFALMIAVDGLLPGAGLDFPGLGLVALLLVFAGLGVAAAGLVAFRRHRTTVDPSRPDRASTLVTSGVFGLTRNPMYLGMALIVTGFGLSTGSLIALCLAPVFVLALDRYQVRPEEAAMRRLFGEAFEAYAARVPRWLLV